MNKPANKKHARKVESFADFNESDHVAYQEWAAATEIEHYMRMCEDKPSKDFRNKIADLYKKLFGSAAAVAATFTHARIGGRRHGKNAVKARPGTTRVKLQYDVPNEIFEQFAEALQAPRIVLEEFKHGRQAAVSKAESAEAVVNRYFWSMGVRSPKQAAPADKAGIARQRKRAKQKTLRAHVEIAKGILKKSKKK